MCRFITLARSLFQIDGKTIDKYDIYDILQSFGSTSRESLHYLVDFAPYVLACQLLMPAAMNFLIGASAADQAELWA